MKILVTENQFKKILREEEVLLKVIKEQVKTASAQNNAPDNTPVDDTALINDLNKAIYTLVNEEKKKNGLSNNLHIKVVGGAKNLSLIIGQIDTGTEVSYKFPIDQEIYNQTHRIQYKLPISTRISAGIQPMGPLLGEIEKLESYQRLAPKHPELTTQIQKGVINGEIKPAGDNAYFSFATGSDPGNFSIKWGEPFPLGSFFKGSAKTKKKLLKKGEEEVNPKSGNAANSLVYNGLAPNTFGYLQSSELEVEFVPTVLKLQQAAPVVQAPVEIVMPQLTDLFAKDSISFANPAAATQQLNNFATLVKKNVIDAGPEAIKHFLEEKPTIEGYASIDGNPDQPIAGGAYSGCAKSGNGTRKDYDLCLSNERARTIAEYLNKHPLLTGLGGKAFGFIGKGETTEFGPNPASNRVFRLTRITASPVKNATAQKRV